MCNKCRELSQEELDLNLNSVYNVCDTWRLLHTVEIHVHVCIVIYETDTCYRAVYRIFAKGGRTWSMSKRGGARLFVAAGQPQGGGCRRGMCPLPHNFFYLSEIHLHEL